MPEHVRQLASYGVFKAGDVLIGTHERIDAGFNPRRNVVNKLLSRLLALLLPLAMAAPAGAQYPNRVIKMIVPFQAGSAPT